MPDTVVTGQLLLRLLTVASRSGRYPGLANLVAVVGCTARVARPEQVSLF